jgi:hypothetical protein
MPRPHHIRLRPGRIERPQPLLLLVAQLPPLRFKLEEHHPVTHQNKIWKAGSVGLYRRAPAVFSPRGPEMGRCPAE